MLTFKEFISKTLNEALHDGNALNNARRKELAKEHGNTYSIYNIKKDGKRYNKPNYTLMSKIDAERRIKELEKLNPNTRYELVNEPHRTN